MLARDAAITYNPRHFTTKERRIMNPRLPAEWEIQDGVLLAWPHEATDWAGTLDKVRPVFAEIIRQITRFERVLLVTPHVSSTAEYLASVGVELNSVTICEIPSNDTWARDFGPITVIYNDKPVLMDFGFNGWGLKFGAVSRATAWERS